MSNLEKFPENQLKIENIRFSENVKNLKNTENDQETVKTHSSVNSVPTPLKNTFKGGNR